MFEKIHPISLLIIMITTTAVLTAGIKGFITQKSLRETLQQLEHHNSTESIYFNRALLNRASIAERFLSAARFSKHDKTRSIAQKLQAKLEEYIDHVIHGRQHIISEKKYLLTMRELYRLSDDFELYIMTEITQAQVPQRMLVTTQETFKFPDNATIEQECKAIIDLIREQPIPLNPFNALIDYYTFFNRTIAELPLRIQNVVSHQENLQSSIEKELDINNKLAALPRQVFIGPKIMPC